MKSFLHKTKSLTALFAIIALLLMPGLGWGQISMTATGSNTQNFNSLPTTGSVTWANNSTISAWYTSLGGSVTANGGSSTTGQLYSYGTGTASDRALGSINTNATTNIAYGVQLQNSSASVITSMTVAYTGEQWRKENNATPDQILFYYQVFSSVQSSITNSTIGWTAVTSLNFTAPIASATTATALDGNASANRTVFSAVTIPSLSIPVGSYIVYKWIDQNISATDHGVAIDDVTVSWTVSAGSTPPALTAAANQTVDNNFNIAFTEDATWRAAVTGITVDGTPYLAASGVYSLTSGSLVLTTASIAQLQTAGSHTIVVLATGYNNASVTQSNIAGVATKLGITTQPTAPAANGGVLANQPVVRIQDQYNNTTTSTANVTAAVGAGTWTLGGTTPVAGVAGTVTYSGLTATSAAAVTGATISFTSSGLEATTSNAFNIPAPPPPAPANDNCAGAIAITCGNSVTVDNTSATDDVLPAVSCGVNSVGYFKGTWYTVTPAASGSVTVSTCSSSATLDTYMRIYGGTCGSFTTCEGSDDDGCGSTAGPSKITFLATANTTYYILLGMYDGSDTPGSVTISATCPLVAPLATAANPISTNSFTANWNASASATGGYKLDVSSTTFNFASTTETFTAIGGGATSSYLTRSWTGVDGITWTSYKTRIDQVINTGNDAITLQDASAAYLVSGEITGSPSNITFDIQQKFAGSGGNVLIKILSGAGFSTVTTIGTYGYTTTTGVINANVTGISGPFKVQIENGNTNARPCIDNLAITRDSYTAVGIYSNYSVVGTSQAIGDLSPNSNYYYRVRATDGTNFSASSNTITVNTNAAAASTFTGTISNEWELAANWSNGIPGAITNATIPANKAAVVNSNDLECNNLTISPLGSLSINTGKDLLANGAFLIESDATGTGSFIENGTLAADSYTVERHLAPYTLIDDKKFHLISSPVAAQAIRTEFVTSTPTAVHDFYSFDELTNMWINTKDGSGAWNNLFESNFAVGKGYLVAYPTEVTKNFTGNLNSAQVVLTCSNTAPPTGGNGWNLLGNPFPSAIDWVALTRSAGLDNALYYYDNAEQKYRYYLSMPGDLTSIGSGSRYIPAMQGFMVHASTGGATLTIPTAAKTHTGQNIYYKSTATVPGSLSLKVAANGHEDEAFIHFNNQATTAFDGAFDAYKLRSYSTSVPNLFTKSSDGNDLAINGLPELGETTVIPVYFEAAAEGEHIMSANLTSMPGALVYLVDEKLNKTQNLNSNPVYTFNAVTGDNSNRFKLTFSSVGIDNPATTSSISVYTHGETLYISGLNAKAEISVVNLTGQVVISSRSNGSGLHSVNAASLPKGVYVVSVISNGQAISRKVVL